MEKEFSEYQVDEMSIILAGEITAIPFGCVGTSEESLDVKNISKKCKGVVTRSYTKQAGTGELKITAHVPVDVYNKIYGMINKKLKDNITSFGDASMPTFKIMQKVLDMDDQIKLKAYPNCTMKTGPARKIDATVEEIPELEMTIALASDENKQCMYEALIDQKKPEDLKLVTDWMTSFSYELVKRENE
ncbi:MAG: hypothetical protein KHY88_00240 [Erysipelotrichaceae bacterium]|nr:hypothetical protein [Erysipelotrichaceae bacterium]